jgi:hypothetical protein
MNISEDHCQVIIKKLRQRRQLAPYWQRLLINLTYPLWQPVVNRIFCELYEEEVIDSSRLHLLSCFFDKTQKSSCLIFLKPKQ